MESNKDAFGRCYYHCDTVGSRTHKQLNNSKKSLGEFSAGILKYGGDVRSFFCLNPTMPRGWVCAVVLLKPENKELFEKETGFILSDPPKITLN